MKPEMRLRPMTPGDRSEVAELIYASINVWYRANGKPEIFTGGPGVTEIFYDVYNDLTPGCNVVAENAKTGRLMGSCFFHPREHHVSLGIMNVHPNYFGFGAGRALLQHIMDFTDENGYKALRLTQSAINIDSFALYNKAGFVPRYAYQDMMIPVPDAGLDHPVDGSDRVRPATLDDVSAMIALELEVSGISREPDYRYCIANARGFWNVDVIESATGDGDRPIDGWMISSGHPAMNLLGPCVARTEDAAAALVLSGLNHYKGRAPVVLIPMDKEFLVRRMYEWGGRVVEMHFCQVRGEFKPFQGVNIPTFLPETG